MKQPELESILKKAQLPEISGEFLEMFPRRIVAGIKRGFPPPRVGRKLSPLIGWALGVATCVVITLAFGHWRGWMEARIGPESDSLASINLIHETLALFPNQVRAIVQDENVLNRLLADLPIVPSSTPNYVRICNGRHCSSLVTFSGQEIQIAGQTITVLSDPNGGIILERNQLVWSSTSRIHSNSNLKIEAKSL